MTPMSPEKSRFVAFFVLTIGCSIVWLAFYILVVHTAVGAGRGGDLGLAMAVAFLFINRDYGGALYQSLRKDNELLGQIQALKAGRAVNVGPSTNAEIDGKIELLAKCISIEAQGHRTENVFFALATVFCTLVATFGEPLAAFLIGRIH